MMKIRSIFPVFSAVAAILFAENQNLLACEEMPGQLEIGVSGATQSPDDPNYYVVQIPEEGEAAVDVTITGSGEVPCPADCVCEADGSVTAAPAESGDPDYTFTHAAGTQNGDKIEWSIDSSETPGEYTFQLTKKSQNYEDCPAGYTGGSGSESNDQASREVTVLAFSAMIDVEKSTAVDGTEGLDVDVVVSPSAIRPLISSVSLRAEKPNGESDYANPDAKGIDLGKRDEDELEWEMLEVRWYEDSSINCTTHPNLYAQGRYKVAGHFSLYGTDYNLARQLFLAEAPGIGTASVDRNSQWWKIGDSVTTPLVTMITVEEQDGGVGDNFYKATVDANDFKRNVRASANVDSSLSSSQFYQMLVDEEEHHVKQLEDGLDAVEPLIHWSAIEVRDEIHGKTVTAMTEEEARSIMLNYVRKVVDGEDEKSVEEVLAYPDENSLRCSLEEAAKNAVGADYHLRLMCRTYPKTSLINNIEQLR